VSTSLGYGDSIILGIVEGLTEFLPVSSTGHLRVAESLLGLKIANPAVTAFTAIIQFGAIVATFIYFRKDLLSLVSVWVRGMFDPQARLEPDYRFAWSVLLGSMPVAVVGIAAKSLIKGPLANLWVVAGALILWSAVIYVAEERGHKKRSEHDLSLKEIVAIGAFQCFALIPGVSRSGATISAALWQDADRVAATRLSFFLGIPALTGASILELKDIDTSVVGWGQLGLGTLVSFFVAYASIAWLLRFVSNHPITLFIGYRIAAGIALMALLGFGAVSAT
jgi:undecaprenyl-diphosphatase